MAQPWELQWIEFEMPDGLKAAYAIDGKEVRMMVDDEQMPDGIDIQERMSQCYDYFFENIYKP